MVTLTVKKDARLDLKITRQNKELLAQAAILRGVDMTSFIIEPALKAAKEVIEKLHLQKVGAKLTKLSKEQADYISVEVDGPFKPNAYRY